MTKLEKKRNLVKKDRIAFQNYIRDILLQCPTTVKPVLVVFKDNKTNTVLKTTCTTNAMKRISDLLHWWLEAIDTGNTPAHVNTHVQRDIGVLEYLKNPKFDFSDLVIVTTDNDGYKEFETIDDVKNYRELFESRYPTVRNKFNEFMDKIVTSKNIDELTS